MTVIPCVDFPMRKTTRATILVLEIKTESDQKERDDFKGRFH